MNEPWADVPSRDEYWEKFGENEMWRYRVALERWQWAVVAKVKDQDRVIAAIMKTTQLCICPDCGEVLDTWTKPVYCLKCRKDVEVTP